MSMLNKFPKDIYRVLDSVAGGASFTSTDIDLSVYKGIFIGVKVFGTTSDLTGKLIAEVSADSFDLSSNIWVTVSSDTVTNGVFQSSGNQTTFFDVTTNAKRLRLSFQHTSGGSAALFTADAYLKPL